MLIDFTVENYRSIKDPVTLSAVAQKGRASKKENGSKRVTGDDEIAPAYPVGGRGIELLPVLAIYGANASGKSNVIRALDALLRFIRFEAQHDNLFIFMPFGLDSKTRTAPTCFELRVALAHSLYTYTLELDRRRILVERLVHVANHSKRRTTRLLFSREWQEDGYTWHNGDDFSGPHLQLQSQLKEYQSFIGLIVGHLNVGVIQDLIFWLRDNAAMISPGSENVDLRIATKWGHLKQDYHSVVCEIVRYFDTGIADIKINEVKTESGNDDATRYEIVVEHDTPGGRISWPFREESTGTQRLFSIAFYIVTTLRFGALMIVDELGSNIHPNVTRHIVRLFQNPATNPNHAQLIFTSHDNTLWRDKLLRRDQIWFTEKRPDHSTALYPLSDFKVRNDLALDKAYLDGRFGAVPILPPEADLLKLAEVET